MLGVCENSLVTAGEGTPSIGGVADDRAHIVRCVTAEIVTPSDPARVHRGTSRYIMRRAIHYCVQFHMFLYSPERCSSEMRRRSIGASSSNKCSGYCVGSSRSEVVHIAITTPAARAGVVSLSRLGMRADARARHLPTAVHSSVRRTTCRSRSSWRIATADGFFSLASQMVRRGKEIAKHPLSIMRIDTHQRFFSSFSGAM